MAFESRQWFWLVLTATVHTQPEEFAFFALVFPICTWIVTQMPNLRTWMPVASQHENKEEFKYCFRLFYCGSSRGFHLCCACEACGHHREELLNHYWFRLSLSLSLAHFIKISFDWQQALWQLSSTTEVGEMIARSDAIHYRNSAAEEED